MIGFDVCGTLYRSNTTYDFVRFLFPLFSRLIFSIPARAINKLSVRFFDFDLIRYCAIRKLRGMHKDLLYTKAEEFVNDILCDLILRKTHELLSTFNIDEVCLISASIDPIINAIAKELGIVNWYSSELDYSNNVCLGVLKKDLLGKKHVLFEVNSFEIMVTDNKSDLRFVLKTNKSYLIASKKTLDFWKKNKRMQDIILLRDR